MMTPLCKNWYTDIWYILITAKFNRCQMTNHSARADTPMANMLLQPVRSIDFKWWQPAGLTDTLVLVSIVMSRLLNLSPTMLWLLNVPAPPLFKLRLSASDVKRLPTPVWSVMRPRSSSVALIRILVLIPKASRYNSPYWWRAMLVLIDRLTIHRIQAVQPQQSYICFPYRDIKLK